MKLKPSQVISFGYISICILIYHLFYWVPYSSPLLNGYLFRIGIALLGIVFFLLVVILEKGNLKAYGRHVSFFLLASALSIAATTFRASLRYPAQSVMDTLGLSARFLWVFWVVPLLYLFKKRNGWESFIHGLNWVSFIWLLTALVQVIVYKVNKSIILDFGSLLDRAAFTRGSLLRIGMGALGNFFLLYNTLRLVTRTDLEHRTFHLWYCILGWPFLVLVQQTRASLIVALGCLWVILFLSSKISKRTVLFAICAFGLAFYLIASGKVTEFFESFSITGVASNNTVARLNGIKYYWEWFKNEPVWAMGFAHSAYYSTLVHGPAGRFFLDDIGFMGTLAQLGLFIIPLYIAPVFRMIWVYGKNRKRLSVFNKKLLELIIAYVVVTSPTLIITDQQRMILWPVLIALVEYIRMSATDTKPLH